eukprot:m.296579 g.296579  ORF g.296579 m.296579 type:complete len:336 (-) comp27193_c1_seq2:166-1173(-)
MIWHFEADRHRMTSENPDLANTSLRLGSHHNPTSPHSNKQPTQGRVRPSSCIRERGTVSMTMHTAKVMVAMVASLAWGVDATQHVLALGDFDGNSYFKIGTWGYVDSTGARQPSETFTWAEARAECAILNIGDLASITSSAENDFVANALVGPIVPNHNNRVNVWLGGHRQNQNLDEGQDVTSEAWRWSDGTPGFASYRNWDGGEPNSGYEQCVFMHNAMGEWIDLWCFASRPALCKVPLVPCTAKGSKTSAPCNKKGKADVSTLAVAAPTAATTSTVIAAALATVVVAAVALVVTRRRFRQPDAPVGVELVLDVENVAFDAPPCLAAEPVAEIV